MQKEKKILIVAIVSGVGLFFTLIHFYGYMNTWHLWNIPAYKPPFLDLRLITGGAESYAAGFDPAIKNPFDPTHRLFNYPKVWYLILASGINQSWTAPIAFVMIGLLLLSVVLFPGKLTWLSTGLLLFALCSAAVMLEFERANVDGFFFILMTLGLLLLDVSVIASFMVFLISIVFKIFPVFGLAYLLDTGNKSSLKYSLLSILFTVMYFAVTLKRMIFIFNNTEKEAYLAYGVSVLPDYLNRLVAVNEVKNTSAFLYGIIYFMNDLAVRFPYITYLIALIIIVLFSLFGLTHRSEFSNLDLKNLRAFWIGAGIYVGTFLLGNNWDYRLIFLLFTIPQLGDWATGKDKQVANISRTVLVLLFLALWYLVINAAMAHFLPLGNYISTVLDQFVDWALFAGLIYLFSFSMPRWLVDSCVTFVNRMSALGSRIKNRLAQ